MKTHLLKELVLKYPQFTSAEAREVTGGSGAQVAHILSDLASQGLITKVMRGVWAQTSHPLFSPYLLAGQVQTEESGPIYVSFTSALSLHGVISQLSPEIHLASAKARADLDAPIGKYVFHQLQKDLITGYGPGDKWGRFNLASPEKALFDTIYISLRRGRQWKFLPELDLPKQWKWSEWNSWIELIESQPLKKGMLESMRTLKKNNRRATVGIG